MPEQTIDLNNIASVLQFGAAGVLMWLLYWAVSGVRCLGRKLFDEEKGLVTLWVQEQREFTRSIKAANDLDRELLSRNTSAIVDMCRVLRSVCRRAGVEVDTEFDRIETAIQSAKTES